MDKDIAHRLASSLGVQVPASVTVRNAMPPSEIIKQAAMLKYPRSNYVDI